MDDLSFDDVPLEKDATKETPNSDAISFDDIGFDDLPAEKPEAVPISAREPRNPPTRVPISAREPAEPDRSSALNDLKAGIKQAQQVVPGLKVAKGALDINEAEYDEARAVDAKQRLATLDAAIAELAPMVQPGQERPKSQAEADTRERMRGNYQELMAQRQQLLISIGSGSADANFASDLKKAAAEKQNAVKSVVQGAMEIGKLSEEIANIPRNKQAEIFTNPYGDDVKSKLQSMWAAISSDPTGVVRELALRSMPASSPTIIASIIGGAAGPEGAAALAGLVGGSVEMGSSMAGYIMDEIQKQGVDTTDKAAVEKWALENIDTVLDMVGKSAVRAGVIAITEGAVGGLSEKLARATEGSGRLVKSGATLVGGAIDAAGEGLGEGTASYAADGKVDIPGAIAETVGGFPQGMVTTGGQIIRENLRPSKKVEPISERGPSSDQSAALNATQPPATPTAPTPAPPATPPAAEVAPDAAAAIAATQPAPTPPTPTPAPPAAAPPAATVSAPTPPATPQPDLTTPGGRAEYIRQVAAARQRKAAEQAASASNTPSSAAPAEGPQVGGTPAAPPSAAPVTSEVTPPASAPSAPAETATTTPPPAPKVPKEEAPPAPKRVRNFATESAPDILHSAGMSTGQIAGLKKGEQSRLVGLIRSRLKADFEPDELNAMPRDEYKAQVKAIYDEIVAAQGQTAQTVRRTNETVQQAAQDAQVKKTEELSQPPAQQSVPTPQVSSETPSIAEEVPEGERKPLPGEKKPKQAKATETINEDGGKTGRVLESQRPEDIAERGYAEELSREIAESNKEKLRKELKAQREAEKRAETEAQGKTLPSRDRGRAKVREVFNKKANDFAAQYDVNRQDEVVESGVYKDDAKAYKAATDAVKKRVFAMLNAAKEADLKVPQMRQATDDMLLDVGAMRVAIARELVNRLKNPVKGMSPKDHYQDYFASDAILRSASKLPDAERRAAIRTVLSNYVKETKEKQQNDAYENVGDEQGQAAPKPTREAAPDDDVARAEREEDITASDVEDRLADEQATELARRARDLADRAKGETKAEPAKRELSPEMEAKAATVQGNSPEADYTTPKPTREFQQETKAGGRKPLFSPEERAKIAAMARSKLTPKPLKASKRGKRYASVLRERAKLRPSDIISETTLARAVDNVDATGLQIYADQFNRRIISMILGRLREGVGEVKVYVVSDENVRRMFGDDDGVGGFYDPNENYIVINADMVYNGKIDAQLLAHEGLHALLHDAIEKIPSIREAITKLAEEAAMSVTNPEQYYGFSVEEKTGRYDPHEFINEALTDPDFQDLMYTIPLSREGAQFFNLKGDRDKHTVWNALRNLVRNNILKMRAKFGNGDRSYTILDAVMKASSDMDRIASRMRASNADKARIPGRANPVRLSAAAKATGTTLSKFISWFKQSKVQQDGLPLVVWHHGTFGTGDNFAPNGPMHFGTEQAARERAFGRTGFKPGDWGVAEEMIPGTYTPVLLSIQNPKRTRDVGTAAKWEEEIKQAKAEGHDGIVYRNDFEDKGSDSWIAFEPGQIKSISATEFDANNPDIRFHRSKNVTSQGNDVTRTGEPRSEVPNLRNEKGVFKSKFTPAKGSKRIAELNYEIAELNEQIEAVYADASKTGSIDFDKADQLSARVRELEKERDGVTEAAPLDKPFKSSPYVGQLQKMLRARKGKQPLAAKYATDYGTFSQMMGRFTNYNFQDASLFGGFKLFGARASQEKLIPHIFEQIDRVISNVEVYVVPDNEFTAMHGADTGAIYSVGSTGDYITLRESAFDSPQRLAHHLLHEGVHAALVGALRQNPLAVKQLAEIAATVDERYNDGQYGFTDADEFLAEFLSNPDFQSLVAFTPVSADAFAALNIPAPGGSSNNVLNMIRRWAVKVFDLLNPNITNFKPNDVSAFDVTMAIVDELLDIAPQVREKMNAMTTAKERNAFLDAGAAMFRDFNEIQLGNKEKYADTIKERARAKYENINNLKDTLNIKTQKSDSPFKTLLARGLKPGQAREAAKVIKEQFPNGISEDDLDAIAQVYRSVPDQKKFSAWAQLRDGGIPPKIAKEINDYLKAEVGKSIDPDTVPLLIEDFVKAFGPTAQSNSDDGGVQPPYREPPAPGMGPPEPPMQQPAGYKGPSQRWVNPLRRFAIKTMTLDFMRQKFGKLFVDEKGVNQLDRFVKAVQRRDNIVEEFAHDLEQAGLEFENLANTKPEQAMELAQLAMEATRLNVKLGRGQKNQHLGVNKATGMQGKKALADLNARYDKLDADTEELYQRLTKLYRDKHNTNVQALVYNILSQLEPKLSTGDVMYLMDKVTKGRLTESDRNLIADDTIFNNLQRATELRVLDGDYFPMMRYGEHVVVTTEKLTDPKWTSIPLKVGKGGKAVSVPVKTELANTQGGKYPNAIRFSVDPTTRGARTALKRAMSEYAASHELTLQGISTLYRDQQTGKLVRKSEMLMDRDYDIVYEARFQTEGVHFFESASEAEKFREQSDALNTSSVMDREEFGNSASVTASSLAAIVNSLPSSKETGVPAKLMKHVIENAVVSQMSGNRAQKRYLARRNVVGASKDIARGAFTYARASANYHATLQTAPEMREAMKAMREIEKNSRFTDNASAVSQVANELRAREESIESPNRPFRAMRDIATLSYFDKLVSPAYSLINGMQPLTTAMPVLSGRYGAIDTTAALSKAYALVGVRDTVGQGVMNTARAARQITQTMIDTSDMLGSLRKNLGPRHEALLNEMIERGILTMDSGQEIGSVIEEGRGAWGRGLAKVDRVARQLPSAVEVLNRAVTAVATYELARQSKKDHKAAIEEAINTTINTQGDYRASNSPRWMKVRGLGWALQFKKYAMLQYQLLSDMMVRALTDSDPAERIVALRQMRNLIITQGALAGVFGLPGLELIKIGFTIAGAFGLGGGWDEEEEWLRKKITENLGETVGSIVNNGLLATVTGFDFSSRLSLSDLATGYPPKTLDPEGLFAYAGRALLGAPGATAIDWMYGTNELINANTDGERERAVQKLIPFKVIADSLKGFTAVRDGEISPARAIGQAAGLTPLSVAEAGRERGGFKRAAVKREKTEKDLRDDLMEALRRQDGGARAKAISAIREYNLQRRREFPNARPVDPVVIIRQFNRDRANKRKKTMNQ